MEYTLHRGDCLAVLRTMADASVDAIVTDPPYGLSFMGKRWDYDVPSTDIWAECLRVLKPGGHLLAFAGTRTQHRMAVNIEDAGFEIRDMIAWVYGSGFPKSLDVSKAIDKARDDSADILRITTLMADAAERAGVTRAQVDTAMGTTDMAGWWLSRLQHRCQCPKWSQWLRLKVLLSLSDDMDAEVWRLNGRKGTPGEAWKSAEVLAVDVRMNEPSGIVSVGQGERVHTERQIKAANSDDARQWQGWGTALKPALEPITVARKPLVGTVAANVLAHGTGALNIDGCRVQFHDDTDKAAAKPGGRTTAASGALAGKAQGGFVIAGPIDDDERLYWSNECGWGSRASATVFHDSAVRDPLGATGREPMLQRAEFVATQGAGRWPANLIHDGSDEVIAAFPDSNGSGPARTLNRGARDGEAGWGMNTSGGDAAALRDAGTGSAARFFYCAKASRADRNAGMPSSDTPAVANGATMREREDANGPARNGNFHPTVKPTALMAYLVRLVTPPGGLVLDPFMGSGSTGKACMREGFRFVGIDLDDDGEGNPLGYVEIARARIEHERQRVQQEPPPAPQQLDLLQALA
ncbi:DNA methyltransferase [Paracidovorax citrulli]|uniref:DNA methyltransferase n=1 Tax=Paracidovorax citrulli TaxID=80869 RepID=UPI0005FB077E|nr:DNA methyltransferase [Paracidovorax citrulli]